MFEELVVRSYGDAGALAGPVVVVVRVGRHHRPVVEVGGQHPRVRQDQLHHGLRLGLPAAEKSFPCQVLLAPRWEVPVQVFEAFVVATSFVITT